MVTGCAIQGLGELDWEAGQARRVLVPNQPLIALQRITSVDVTILQRLNLDLSITNYCVKMC